MNERTLLDLDECMVALDRMVDRAGELGKPMALAVVDQYGDLLGLLCMDGTTAFVQHYAIKKAYTAARMGSDLADFAARLKSQGRSAREYADPNLVSAAKGGAVARATSGVVVGAIGASGGTPDEDEEVVRLGLTYLGL